MRKIFAVVLLFFCITPIALGKEYRIDVNNTVVTVDIPASYDVITKDNLDPAVLRKIGTTAENVREHMEAMKIFLYCINFDALTEIHFISDSSPGAKIVGTWKDDVKELSSPRMEKLLTEQFSVPNFDIKNYFVKDFPDAAYAGFQGYSSKQNQYGRYAYFKNFLTFKNGVVFYVQGIAWSGEGSAIDATLENIVSNMHLTPKKILSSNGISVKQVKGNNWAEENVISTSTASRDLKVTPVKSYDKEEGRSLILKIFGTIMGVGLLGYVFFMARQADKRKEEEKEKEKESKKYRADDKATVNDENSTAISNVNNNVSDGKGNQYIPKEQRVYGEKHDTFPSTNENNITVTDVTENKEEAEVYVSEQEPVLTLNDLRELKQLLDEGVITQEDFDRVKKKILG